MAQTRRSGTSRTNRNSYNRNTGNRRAHSAYIYDNTARDLQVQRQLEEAPRRQLSNETRKNREKARHMSFGYVAFLVGALFACGMVLINYVQLQAELTNKRQEVAILESELNSMRLANDEEYSRITSSIDLEQIKRIAIGELGMVYAEEGQIISYTNEGNDYMRRVSNETN
ncbi:MAG: LapA family protein [Lachnospiraceae bacterium]|nr:LapA family protein [Lachnospiraceae bacterium]